jgi:hypothetical protein
MLLEKPLEKKEWTIMAYVAGGEDLCPAARDGLLQMKQVGSTSKFHLVAQFDAGREGPTKRYYFPEVTENRSQEIDKARKMISIRRMSSILSCILIFFGRSVSRRYRIAAKRIRRLLRRSSHSMMIGINTAITTHRKTGF